MTLSWPSALAAAIRAVRPPPAAAEVAVVQSAVLAADGLLLAGAAAELAADELLAGAAAELLELLLELLQPAASKMEPTEATVATIAFDARKVKTLPCRPHGSGGK